MVKRRPQAHCPQVKGEGRIQSCHAFAQGAQAGALTAWCALSPRVEELGPAESQFLQGEVAMLQGLLEQVQQQVAQQAQAQAKVRTRQHFLQESRRLLLWADGVRARLNSKEEAVNVASAQRLLGEHQDLLKEIQLQQERSGQEGQRGCASGWPQPLGKGHQKGRGWKRCVPYDWPRLMSGMLFKAGLQRQCDQGLVGQSSLHIFGKDPEQSLSFLEASIHLSGHHH